MNTQDKNLDREGGKKCTYPRCACDSKAACTVPQAGAAVPSEQDKRLAIAAAKNESLSVHARVMAAINARQSKAARWFYSNAPEEHVRELVSWVLSITSASGAGEVKPWRERLTPEGEDEYDLADQHTAAETAMMAEIADLRAQLARQHQETDAALVESEQLKAYRASDRAYIEELEAAARQHQDSKPTDLSKRLRVLSNPTSPFDAQTVSRTVLIEAADEIERLAAAQGEPVAKNRKSKPVAIYQVESGEFGDDWRDVPKAKYEDTKQRGFKTRIVYTAPPAAQAEPLVTPDADSSPCAQCGTEGVHLCEKSAAQAVPGDEVRDAKRWRFSMEFQELARTGAPQPEAIKAMWRKVYAEGRLHPTREEYEAATDAAIALRATKTEGEEQQ